MFLNKELSQVLVDVADAVQLRDRAAMNVFMSPFSDASREEVGEALGLALYGVRAEMKRIYDGAPGPLTVYDLADQLKEQLHNILPELTVDLLRPLLFAANGMPSELGRLEPVISLGVLIAALSELSPPGREELQLIFAQASKDMATDPG